MATTKAGQKIQVYRLNAERWACEHVAAGKPENRSIKLDKKEDIVLCDSCEHAYEVEDAEIVKNIGVMRSTEAYTGCAYACFHLSEDSARAAAKKFRLSWDAYPVGADGKHAALCKECGAAVGNGAEICTSVAPTTGK